MKRVRHYYLASLGARCAAFLALVICAVATPETFQRSLHFPWVWSPVTLVWLALMASMVLRLFPSRVESLGTQKLHASQCRLNGHVPNAEEIRRANRGAWKVMAVWCLANAAILLWNRAGERFLVCLAGFYGVCDMICILFYCPFRHLLMGNRCCTVCRIFDWDYLMMCTPLLGVRGILPAVALVFALVIFLRWEILFHLHPERFLESSNTALRCSNCQEKLCQYRRTLDRAVHAGCPRHCR